MTGLELVNQAFASAKAQNRAAFMPYYPVGFPDLATSLDIMEGLAHAGADALEVGVPFSDPLADGVVIQHATQVALQNGVSLPDCLEALRELRRRGVQIPLMLMSYVNPLLAYGQAALIQDATQAGASGFIVPDLPADEAADFQALVAQNGAAFAHFLAPTSGEDRIKLAAQMARGFIYLVSVTGVTGARSELSTDLGAFIARVRQHARQPLVVGFGIGTPEKAQSVGKIADGIIIGSKFITLTEEGGKDAALDFARVVRAALG